MSLQITGELRFFKNITKTKDGEIVTYTTNINKKLKDGSYDKAYAEVVFPEAKLDAKRRANIQENVCYTIKVTDGFLSYRKYSVKKADNQDKTVVVPIIVVNEFEVIESKEVASKSSPF